MNVNPTIGFPKPPKGEARKAQRSRRRVKDVDDQAESRKVTVRSRGRCEFREVFGDHVVDQCYDRATEVHHCFGGNGRRVDDPESRQSDAKLALCERHHHAIHGGGYELGGRGPTGVLYYKRKSS